ncbi:hypothetical protein [Methanothrix sp.]|uniref:hypothetical protein n=1 Tax=Methanothrix sp. TaxID=90426 RepID=UPI00257E7682|nr:hypothetical protein [Methanothrix sp.]NPU87559.1 hypothetical protein [Methanothrix sp.]
MKRIILLLAVMVIIGLSSAQEDLTLGKYPYEVAEKNVTFNFEQDVQGSGYFMTYRYAKAGALAFKDYVHGSGSIDNEFVMFTQELDKNTHPIDADWVDEDVSCISVKEDNVMVYSPYQFAIGTGYYAVDPLVFDSLLKEKTWIKNYRAGTSMHHEVEYAHGIDKELEILAKEKYFHQYDPVYEGVGYSQMKITEHVDNGKVHFGVLQASSDRAYKNPAIEIDEDYFGTYDITKNMTLNVPYKLVQKSEDWLPCCSGGWADIPAGLKKGFGASAEGIFDCSCLKKARAGMYGPTDVNPPFKEWA